MMLNLDRIRETFGSSFSMEEIRPDLQAIHLPIFGEDGDALGIFLRTVDSTVFLTDVGTTLMRLSYTYNMETEARMRIFSDILRENRVEFEDGEIRYPVRSADLYPDLLHFAHVLAKVSALEYFKAEVVASLFYENFREVVYRHLEEYAPIRDVSLLGDNNDFIADYAFHKNLRQPIYVFAVRGNTKALESTACLLAYQQSRHPYLSVVVYDDYHALTSKNFNRLTTLADKQYLELAEFEEHGPSYFARNHG